MRSLQRHQFAAVQSLRNRRYQQQADAQAGTHSQQSPRRRRSPLAASHSKNYLDAGSRAIVKNVSLSDGKWDAGPHLAPAFSTKSWLQNRVTASQFKAILCPS